MYALSSFNEAVVDSSILVQAVIREEYSEAAISIVNQLKAIYAPQLLLYEVGSALTMLARKGLITEKEALEKFEAIHLIPTLNIQEPTLKEAVNLAVKLKLSFYDATYLTLAIETGLPLITADKELREKGASVSRVIHASDLKL